MWYLYIVECSDGSLYTGITTDIGRRVHEHNNKIGAKSVRGKLPVKLVHSEQYPDNVTAAKRERQIKSMPRKKKLEIVNIGISDNI
ncbi:MAG: GIY-YIG nuclease family protein [Candidatus Roizmanbacteria bacterium]